MDFKFIVEHNEAYSRDNLKEKDKAFNDGMRFVLDNVVDEFIANYFFGSEESIIGKIKEEIVGEAIEELKKYIESTIAEDIVSTIDGYDDNELLIKGREHGNERRMGKSVG